MLGLVITAHVPPAVESCVATDLTACSEASISGAVSVSRDSCLSAGACVYTAAAGHHPHGSGRICDCIDGYTSTDGSRSCVDFDECSSRPCANSSTCAENIDSYACTCEPGYGGDNCEVGERVRLDSVRQLWGLPAR